MMLQRWPPIDSHAALLEALKDHLGYCTCAYDTAVPFLRDFLRLVAERRVGGWHALRYSEGRAEAPGTVASCSRQHRRISWPACESLIPRPAKATSRNAACVTTSPASRAS
jgi:hypothetical protein